METPKTFKELFANTGIEPTTDESGNTHYNFKATMKEEPKQETLEEPKQEQTAIEWLIETNFGSIENCTPDFRNKIEQAKEMEKQQQGFSEEDLEVAFFEGQFGKYSFNDWFEQFKNK